MARPLLGVHVSIAGSLDRAVDRAREIGCHGVFQIFTRNPRGWAYKKLDKKEVELFREKKEKGGLQAIAHMPYLPNISSPKKDVHQKSVRSLIAELGRCGELGIPILVCHVGSHLGLGLEAGIRKAAEACNRALGKVGNDVVIALENMAGQRNSCGSYFQDIRRILDLMEHPERVGVCLDTCHLYAAGYDISDQEPVSSTIDEFDKAVGLKRLTVVHLNDSKGGLGSGLDRHEHIGMGKIRDKGFKAFINHPAIRDLPMILETPEDARGNFRTNLERVRKLYKE